jgi:hypothetical protein
VFQQREIVLQSLDRCASVDDALGLPHGRLAFFPDAGAVLPSERVDLHDGAVVALCCLVRDAIEVVAERLSRQLLTRDPSEKLAEIADHVPIDVVHLLRVHGRG